jgi:hypothetical protein
VNVVKLKRAIFALVFALILSISSVYAWFEIQNNHQIDLETGIFEVELDILLNDVPITGLEDYYDSINHLLELDAFNPISANHISHLKVVMTVTTKTAARLRFRIQDEWRLIRNFYAGGTPTIVILPHDTLMGELSVYPFNIHNSFFSNDEDPYFYYDGLLEKDQTLQITLIDGGQPYAVRITENYFEEVYIRFQIFLDVVQANRIVEVWGVDAGLFD